MGNENFSYVLVQGWNDSSGDCRSGKNLWIWPRNACQDAEPITITDSAASHAFGLANAWDLPALLSALGVRGPYWVCRADSLGEANDIRLGRREAAEIIALSDRTPPNVRIDHQFGQFADDSAENLLKFAAGLVVRGAQGGGSPSASISDYGRSFDTEDRMLSIRIDLEDDSLAQLRVHADTWASAIMRALLKAGTQRSQFRVIKDAMIPNMTESYSVEKCDSEDPFIPDEVPGRYDSLDEAQAEAVRMTADARQSAIGEAEDRQSHCGDVWRHHTDGQGDELSLCRECNDAVRIRVSDGRPAIGDPDDLGPNRTGLGCGAVL